MYVTKAKIVALNVIKSFVSRPEMGPKHFDKLKPEPGPNPARNPARPEKSGPTYNPPLQQYNSG